jgi:putative addiction module component (TIGR02574 family)
MPSAFETLRQQVLLLSQAERAQLAHDLILSLEEGPEEDPLEVEQAWRKEIERRIAGMDSGKAEGIPSTAFP